MGDLSTAPEPPKGFSGPPGPAQEDPTEPHSTSEPGGPANEATGSWAAGQHAAAVEDAAMQAVLKEQEADMTTVLAGQR